MTWTPDKDDFLRQNYQRMSNSQIATTLGIKPRSISWRLHSLGLRRRPRPDAWTAAEDTFLRRNYCSMNCTELAAAISARFGSRRSKAGISGRLNKLGLKRPPKVAAAMSRETCFPKGMTPWNKGKKGLRLAPATEFKPGNKPHNTLYDGAIRTRRHKRTNRPYQWIRLAENHWIMLHVFLWEKAHGPVPDGHIVVFRNKDTMDIRLDNLECISQAENARRNANRAKAAKSMKKYWRNPSDRHLAGYIAPGDPELRKEIIHNHPELLQAKRLQLNIRRKLKELQR